MSGDSSVTAPATDLAHTVLKRVAEKLADLQRRLADVDQDPALSCLVGDAWHSARNLLCWLRLRDLDLRTLQTDLHSLGLSSLGRSEAAIADTLEALRITVEALLGAGPRGAAATLVRDELARERLHKRADDILGTAPVHRTTRVMVTLPSEAALSATLVDRLVHAGMDIARINLAHDDKDAWSAMAAGVRAAADRAGRRVLLAFDLVGPKIRTGPLPPGPLVLRVRPKKDALGKLVAPATLWLTPAKAPARAPGEHPPQSLPVAGEFLSRLLVDDVVAFRDARGRPRKLRIVERRGDSLWGELKRSAYIETGTILHHMAGTGSGRRAVAHTMVGALNLVEPGLLVYEGERLILTRALVPGVEAQRARDGTLITPARIGCTAQELFASAQPGQPLFIDDGRIAGQIAKVTDDEIEVDLVRVPPNGARVRPHRGINVPLTHLDIPGFTAEDEASLEHIRDADIVGLSFAWRGEDLKRLRAALSARGCDPAIVLKVETRRGYAALPALLLEALHDGRVGLMIARGDLAVEAGFEHLAEAQEEMLALGEAAQIPVIWATQVLETLAKTGLPTRAEVTDAAQGGRAEAVMLNKGPFVTDAVAFLDHLLTRTESHRKKHLALLPALDLQWSRTKREA